MEWTSREGFQAWCGRTKALTGWKVPQVRPHQAWKPEPSRSPHVGVGWAGGAHLQASHKPRWFWNPAHDRGIFDA